MRILRLFFLLMCAVWLLSCEQPPETILTSNPLVSDLDQDVDEVVRAYMQDPDHVGVSVAVWQNGQAHVYGYGETAKGNTTLPNEHTIFEIGSISKTFTAAMLTEVLAERGLSVETPVRLLIPSDIPTLEKDGQEILVKHLLNHSSGLPRLPDDLAKGYDKRNPYVHYDSTRVYAFLKQYELKRKPGVEFEYSNLAMGLAGLIIERLTGSSYDQNLSARIAQPLGLTQTSISVAAGSDFAKGYNKQGREVSYWDMTGVKGAGAIRADAWDLLLYGKAQLGGAPAPLDSVFTRCHEATFTQEAFSMGLGWFLIEVNGKSCWFHDGGTGGFSSFLYVCPATNQVLAILANSSDPKGTQTLGVGLAEKVVK